MEPSEILLNFFSVLNPMYPLSILIVYNTTVNSVVDLYIHMTTLFGLTSLLFWCRRLIGTCLRESDVKLYHSSINSEWLHYIWLRSFRFTVVLYYSVLTSRLIFIFSGLHTSFREVGTTYNSHISLFRAIAYEFWKGGKSVNGKLKLAHWHLWLLMCVRHCKTSIE